MWKFGTLTVSPFDWLEASYFYYRPSDLIWAGVPGWYLDKGFNVKIKHKPKNKNLPSFALGLDDFAGTGYFTREYIVTTQELRNLKLSLGIGWGKFVGSNSFNNPLSYLNDAFGVRPEVSSNYDFGGTPSYDKWFRGNSTIFGGIEYFPLNIKGLSFKLEYDPYDYFDFSANNKDEASFVRRNKDSNINLGITYALNKYLTLDLSYIKGNTINLSFNIGTTFNGKLRTKPKFNPNIKKGNNQNSSKSTFYKDLLFNINNNNLLLQTASLSDKKLDISISTSQYRNAIRSSSYAGTIAKEVSKNNNIEVNQINISHINVGIELNNITFIADHLDSKKNVPLEIKKRHTKIDSGNRNSYQAHEFQPNVKFPVVFSSFTPAVVNYIGNPRKFYHGGVDIHHNSEIQFKRNLILTGKLGYSLFNNFDETSSNPSSDMEHVRTDKVRYLQDSDLYITRLQLDYLWSPRKNMYAKLSGGFFEDMFAGVGGQFLYKPFDSKLNISVDAFYVQQRGYKRQFSLNDYKTTTGHINFGYLLPLGIESNISIGRYLAKDDGYTFDLSRTTKSGFKAGIYFTRTNVSFDLFGEGSFDKGFYFQVPMELFSNDYRGDYSAFKLSPLTRDGGAKLEYDKDLRGLIYNTTSGEFLNSW